MNKFEEKLMNEAAQFLMDKSVIKTKVYYENFVVENNKSFSKQELDELKKIRNKSKNAGIVLRMMRKTGDVYKYLLSVTKKENVSIRDLFRKYHLVPFEDLVEEFKKKFANQLDELLINNLVEGNVYTTYDFVFMGGQYRCDVNALLPVKDANDEIVSFLLRGKFDSNNPFDNRWIDESTLEYVFYEYPSNKCLVEREYPIYVFETLESNKHVFKGIFKLKSYDKEKKLITLFKDDKKATTPIIKDNYVLPTSKPFKKFIDKQSARRSGTEETGKAKVGKGKDAENRVIYFLKKLGFDAENVANNSKYPFDILIKDLSLGLEVKNIENGYFYISENEIRTFEKNESRICFVDNNQILISNDYDSSTNLKKIFEELRLIDANLKDTYDGQYEADSLKIGITEKNRKGLLKDFNIVKNLTYKQLVKILRNEI